MPDSAAPPVFHHNLLRANKDKPKPLSAAAEARLRGVTDDYLRANLPGWLKGATAEQLKVLRVCFNEHRESQQQVREALKELKPLVTYAKELLAPGLKNLLGEEVDLDRAQWREHSPKFDRSTNSAEFRNRYWSALQQFMQNFKDDERFFPGTALVYPVDAASHAPERVLWSDTRKLVALCRTLDIGGSYQLHLNTVFDDSFKAVLAKDRRRQLALAAQIAGLKGQLVTDDLKMLSRVTKQQEVSHAKSISVACGELKLLGARVDGALAFELRGAWEFEGGGATLPLKPVKGVILYLPANEQQPLHHYANWRAANLALGEQVRTSNFREALTGCIALADRAAWLETLGKRLKDPQTDVQPSLSAVTGGLFDTVAARHLQRIRDDAAFLAVPTAKVDAAASSARLKALETAGLVLLNLAAFFVPGVGEVLLANMIAQTLGEAFEGIDDWAQGHRHEALEHLLDVAQTVAVVGATVAAGSLVRSAFVDSLVPMNRADGAPRLRSTDLAAYAQVPTQALIELDNGLLSDGREHWWRDAEGLYYRVRPSTTHSNWELVHPSRADAYAPRLVGNGERAWWLATEHPLEWQGTRVLLARLWPPALQVDEGRIDDMLKVADVDQDHLRGLLVEGRPLPVALRDTIERFAVDARLESFFGQVDQGLASDTELLQWCVGKLGIASEAFEVQVAAIQQDAPELREQMLEQFSRRYLCQDPQLAQVMRELPGLPDAYALHLLEQVGADLRERMITEARLPLEVIERAQVLLRQAQLTRMREGLYLRGSHGAQSTELVFALLRRNGAVPASVNLVLREGSDVGPLLARLQPEAPGQTTTTLVRRNGRFRLFDERGLDPDIDLAEPGGLAEVLLACLPEARLERLGWTGSSASERVLADLRAWLPEGEQAQTRLVGLRPLSPASLPRLVEGRRAYLRGGRGPGDAANRNMLRDRVRSLYRGFNDREVDVFVNILLEQPGSALANLREHEQAYRQLDEALHGWVVAERAVAAQGLRRLVANELRRSWRLEGEAVWVDPTEAEGRRLSLIGIPVGSLPTLPLGADFSHVVDLTLVGLRLEQLPSNFLRSFPQLRRLNLSNNQLRAVPADIERLRSLRTLTLSRNRIRMTASGARALRALTHLRDLDLSVNALGGISLEFRQMSGLREVNLRRTGLLTVPSGLEWCGFLRYADLRDNQIATLPQALLDAPYEFRQGLDFSGNPLPVAMRQSLHAPNPVPPVGGPGGAAVTDSRSAWLATLDAQVQPRHGEQWDALRAEPGSDGLFQLLQELTESSDYRQAQQDLGRRVWAVVDAAMQDSALREELFNLAGSERTCVDSVISCFSFLEVRTFVSQALREGLPEQAESIRLGVARRLYRLDQVERIARDTISQRLASGVPVDEVEVSLAYRIGLARELELPGQPRTMQFRSIADVTEAQLRAAAREVRALEGGAGLAEFISARDFWVAYLKEAYAERFAEVEQPFWDRLEALEQGDQAEGARLVAMNQLGVDRDKALKQLALRLTRERLAAQVGNRR
ncbi:NEL-type E3 ubiquitin ligase domain-containing protein [Pseudomonas sp. NPDC089406]|uniref:NEL-type E3 ubiquitin ligase domain-containing protein n=1 Tax=Pseudomonas sp. NPDC089406 TaxID=3364463 RepID=UPI00384BCCD3